MNARIRRKARALTPRQQRFVVEYAKDPNATAAAKRAGYSARNARFQGARLLADVGVRAAVNEVLGESLRQAKLEVQAVDRQIAAIVHADVRQYFRPDGRLLPMSAWPPGAAAAVASIEVIERRLIGKAKATVVKLRLADKIGALGLACRRLDLLSDRVHVSGQLRLEDLVLASMRPKEGEGR